MGNWHSAKSTGITRMAVSFLIIAVIVVAGVAAYTVLSGPTPTPSTTSKSSSASTTSSTSSLQALYEAAKKEGTVNFYSSITTQLAGNLTADFSAQYPGITVQVQRVVGPYPNIQSEQSSGKYWADVVSEVLPDMVPIQQAGWFESTNPINAAGFSSSFVSSDHTWYITDSIPYILAYNTKHVNASQLPKTWMDLCNPTWKGRFGMPDPVSFDLIVDWFAAMKPVMGNNYGTFVTCVKNLNPVYFKTLTPVAQGLAAGQVDIGITLTSSLAPQILAGDPVAVDTNITPLGALVEAHAVVKHAPHPNAALLFLEYLLSQRSQKIQTDIGGYITQAGYSPSIYSNIAKIPTVPVGYYNSTQLQSTRTEMGLPW